MNEIFGIPAATLVIVLVAITASILMTVGLVGLRFPLSFRLGLRNLLRRIHFDCAVFHHGIYVPQGIIGEVARHERVRVVEGLREEEPDMVRNDVAGVPNPLDAEPVTEAL